MRLAFANSSRIIICSIQLHLHRPYEAGITIGGGGTRCWHGVGMFMTSCERFRGLESTLDTSPFSHKVWKFLLSGHRNWTHNSRRLYSSSTTEPLIYVLPPLGMPPVASLTHLFKRQQVVLHKYIACLSVSVIEDVKRSETRKKKDVL